MTTPIHTPADAQTPKRPRKKSPAQRLWSIHWWMTAVYLPLFIGGYYMARLSREVAYRGLLYEFHKSLGVLTMALLTARILFLLLMLNRKRPTKGPLPTWERIWAIANHTVLYLLMFVVPVSGWFLSDAYGKGVNFFGLPLPQLFPKNIPLAELGRNLHFWLAYAALALIILHAIDERKFLRATLRRWLKAHRKPHQPV